MKKAQIFMLDFILSIVVLMVAFVIIFSYFGSTTPNKDIYDLNNEIVNAFTTTPINSLNDQSIRAYFTARKIKNVENTVAQQVIEFYFLNQTSDARGLTRDFMSIYIPDQISINVLIETSSGEVSIYNKTSAGRTFQESRITSTTSRLVLGNHDGNLISYQFIFRLWQ